MYNIPPSFNLFGLVQPLPYESSEIYPQVLGGKQIFSSFATFSKKKKGPQFEEPHNSAKLESDLKKKAHQAGNHDFLRVFHKFL